MEHTSMAQSGAAESDTMQGLSPRAQGPGVWRVRVHLKQREGQKTPQSFLSASTLLRFLMPYPVLTATS